MNVHLLFAVQISVAAREPGHGHLDSTDRSGTGAEQPTSLPATRRAAPELAPRIRNSLGESGRRVAEEGSRNTCRPLQRDATTRKSSAQPAKKFSQLPQHLRRRFHAIRRAHQHIQRAEIFLLKPKGLPDISLESIAIDRSGGVLSCDQNSKTRRPIIFTPLKIERITADIPAFALAQEPYEQRALREAPIRSESELPCRPGSAAHAGGKPYNPRRLRPRALRARKTARPPGVRLRTRKP